MANRHPCPACEKGSKRPGQVLCRACWRGLPRHLRDRFYATRPHSNQRRQAVLDVYRHVMPDVFSGDGR